MSDVFPELRIGELTARVPIVQGGMGVAVSLSGLASAVAEAGGIGVIAAAGIGGMQPDVDEDLPSANRRALRQEIRRAKSLTKGIVGVNIMVALSDFADLCAAAIDENVDVIFAGAGLPMDLPRHHRSDRHTKLVPIVSSARALRLIAHRWIERFNYPPDAVVVEGPLAGGHLGFKLEQIDNPDYALEKLVPPVVAEACGLAAKIGRPVPVIVGGGIYTGQDIYRFMQMGVDGVQMATRFVGTIECDASAEFKQAYLAARKEDIVIIRSPVGMPGRALRNRFIDEVSRGQRQPFDCPYHCIVTCDVANSPYCIALALTSARDGNLDHGFAFAGANAYRVNEIIPVRELIARLATEYASAAGAEHSEKA